MRAAHEMTAPVPLPGASVAFDVHRVREDFPLLRQQVHGQPLAYLDNAATSQKPQAVIDTLTRYYGEENSNVHRGVHLLSERATEAYEAARANVRRFLNAADTREIIFVRGTTEGINLVAQSYGRASITAGDEIIISWMEHHSNIVPWQMLCEEKGAVLRVVPINDHGEALLDEYERLLNPRTKFVALVHVSNALGTVLPLRQFLDLARARGITTLVDGAQAVPHQQVDVQELGCDFYAFSGHKMYGPTGIGVLYGRERILGQMPPWQGGGEMILSVSFTGTTYNHLPHRFEAGTPNIAGAIGLGAAIEYLEAIGIDRIGRHEQDLLQYATARLEDIPGLTLVGTAPEKSSLVSFTVAGIHPHDLGTVLDAEGIAVRTGHHCAMPVMEYFGVPATTRASFGLYNTRAEIDALHAALIQAIRMLR